MSGRPTSVRLAVVGGASAPTRKSIAAEAAPTGSKRLGGASAKARGFTLLEVVLAFALLAIGIGLLLGILSGGLRQVRMAQAASEATLYAESLLDTLGATERIEPGETSGEFDDGRYRWHMNVSDYVDPLAATQDARARDGAPQPQSPVVAGRLYRVALEIEWGRAKAAQRLRFVTARALAPDATDATDAGLGRSPVPEADQ